MCKFLQFWYCSFRIYSYICNAIRLRRIARLSPLMKVQAFGIFTFIIHHIYIVFLQYKYLNKTKKTVISDCFLILSWVNIYIVA